MWSSCDIEKDVIVPGWFFIAKWLGGIDPSDLLPVSIIDKDATNDKGNKSGYNE